MDKSLINSLSLSTSVTRPDNTTAYAVNDVIGASTGSGAALVVANVGELGRTITLRQLILRCSATSKPSGMTSFRIHIFTKNPTCPVDNAAFTLVSADAPYYKGYVDTGDMTDVGAFLIGFADNINKDITLEPDETSLYYILTTNSAFTPTALAVKTITSQFMR